MKRRAFLSGLIAGAAVAGPALAQDLVDDIVRQLKRQGLKSVVTERTLLGRVRILASGSDGTREIILNPRTGEILRDLWTPASGRSGKVKIIDDRSSGKGGKDHDDDDDDDDDDNSGHGGSGSGGGDHDDDDDDDDDDD